MSGCPDIAFDEHGQRVLTVDFDYPMEPGEEAPSPRLGAGAALLATLGLIVDGERACAGVGRRALLAAYILRGQLPEAPHSLSELAKRLGCSKAAAHRGVTRFRSELAQMRGKQTGEG